MTKIMLTGTLTCAPHEVETLLEVMDTHIRLSRAEPGCLTFELWQDELKPCDFHHSEVFRDAAALRKHQARTQSADWGRITAHMKGSFEEKLL